MNDAVTGNASVDASNSAPGRGKRKFAQEEIRPISLQRDHIPDAGGTWDWEIIRKGSKLGFRTAVVPKEWGGYGIDFVTQALVMAELARADSAVSKAFSQNWKLCDSSPGDGLLTHHSSPITHHA